MKQLYKKKVANKPLSLELPRQSQEFNEETISAMREARLISEKKIPAKSFNNIKELLEDLISDVDD